MVVSGHADIYAVPATDGVNGNILKMSRKGSSRSHDLPPARVESRRFVFLDWGKHTKRVSVDHIDHLRSNLIYSSREKSEKKTASMFCRTGTICAGGKCSIIPTTASNQFFPSNFSPRIPSLSSHGNSMPWKQNQMLVFSCADTMMDVRIQRWRPWVDGA